MDQIYGLFPDKIFNSVSGFLTYRMSGHQVHYSTFAGNPLSSLAPMLDTRNLQPSIDAGYPLSSLAPMPDIRGLALHQCRISVIQPITNAGYPISSLASMPDNRYLAYHQCRISGIQPRVNAGYPLSSLAPIPDIRYLAQHQYRISAIQPSTNTGYQVSSLTTKVFTKSRKVKSLISIDNGPIKYRNRFVNVILIQLIKVYHY